MKMISMKSGWMLAALGVVSLARAEDENFPGQFSLNYRAAFGVSASFSGVGGFAAPNNPGAGAPGTIPHPYDDGFVGVDNLNNAGGYTSYWGYNNASQISGGNVLMHSSSAQAINSGDVDSSHQQNGIELAYTQALIGGEHWRLGFDVAFDWTGIHLLDDRALSGNVVTVTTSYGLGGALPPPAPYSGSPSGVGPLLESTPNGMSSATTMGTASVTGSRNIDADYFGFRVGPSLEFPFGKYFSIGLGGGLAFGLMDSEFSYNENVTVSGLGTQTHIASGHDDSMIWGGYLRAQANVHLNNRVSLFGGVEFDDLGTYDQNVGGETAHLNLSHTLYLTAGVSFNF